MPEAGLGSIKSNVLPLDAFELENSDEDAQVLNMRPGWTMQYMTEVLAAIDKMAKNMSITPEFTRYPSNTLYPFGEFLISS
ncbi:MAG TPA: hypothetical protein VLH56_18830 [Dissulfurispiraceae bacterium]|nr:hypothetical protein [Dissulfurispiraceae bacterium]